MGRFFDLVQNSPEKKNPRKGKGGRVYGNGEWEGKGPPCICSCFCTFLTSIQWVAVAERIPEQKPDKNVIRRWISTENGGRAIDPVKVDDKVDYSQTVFATLLSCFLFLVSSF